MWTNVNIITVLTLVNTTQTLTFDHYSSMLPFVYICLLLTFANIGLERLSGLQLEALKSLALRELGLSIKCRCLMSANECCSTNELTIAHASHALSFDSFS